MPRAPETVLAAERRATSITRRCWLRPISLVAVVLLILRRLDGEECRTTASRPNPDSIPIAW